MSFTTQNNNIIIVGGGLGGLALAQGLKNSSLPVPFHIFERDSSANFRPQGYRIRINPDGAGALQKLLPDNLWEAFKETCAQVKSGMHSIDAFSGQKPPPGVKGSGPPPMPAGKSYNADRVILRNVLLSGLEDNISFGKTFKGYCLTTEGVEVTFTDGTKETGAVLVGADGTRSHVRQQLMPYFPLLDTECGAIFGKTFITSETEVSLAPEVLDGICLAGTNEKSPLKLFSDTMEFSQDIDPGSRTAYKVPDDYVYWVLCINKGFLPSAQIDFQEMDNAQSAEKTLEMTRAWHPTIRSLLENQDEHSSSTLRFFACSPEMFKREWDALVERPESIIVTLLGDAAHPMTPVGGVGANSAFQEAADLCNVLTRSFYEQTDALKAYAKLMMERVEKTMGLSAQGAGRMLEMRPFAELKPVSL